MVRLQCVIWVILLCGLSVVGLAQVRGQIATHNVQGALCRVMPTAPRWMRVMNKGGC